MVALPFQGVKRHAASAFARSGAVVSSVNNVVVKIPFADKVLFSAQATKITDYPPISETSENEPIRLTLDQVEEFGRALDEIRFRHLADLGDRDRQYIYSVLRTQRALEVAGRGLFYLSFIPPVWLAAVGALAMSKIIDNLEIGHNVMHGQYDFMHERGFNSRVFEWDMAVQSDLWRYSHNYRHHTFTNVADQDRDIGFGVMRMDEDRPWHPFFLLNPVLGTLIVVWFEWLTALHVLELDHSVVGGDTKAKVKKVVQHWWAKIAPQAIKDYVFFPALSGPLFPLTFAGNATANIIRNLWVGNLVFCGHFPAGSQTFSDKDIEGETRGEWYLRQILGSANFTGSRLFHILSGHTGHQVEHHLFPDIPAWRLPEISVEVQALCEKYGLPYNTGRLSSQLLSAWVRIVKLGLPPSWVKPEAFRTVIVDRGARRPS
ncbi:acyl-CoA desaturase [Hoyosella rhizosphaerae]|uniref:Fatty acid desaturase n=2 Tax=Hoyosella rhizosphaerae TaxID=1755582 RepID=A0A916UC56_9ACTN|nr:acyl-CoA desaturase [Hoyosella rhizosphaerae]GGC67615.1 putative fatty acid desaturase [Hoyosella rhizosphaerae]